MTTPTPTRTEPRHTLIIRSTTDLTVEYRVTLEPDSCECLDWQYRCGRGLERTCKHVRDARARTSGAQLALDQLADGATRPALGGICPTCGIDRVAVRDAAELRDDRGVWRGQVAATMLVFCLDGHPGGRS